MYIYFRQSQICCLMLSLAAADVFNLFIVTLAWSRVIRYYADYVNINHPPSLAPAEPTSIKPIYIIVGFIWNLKISNIQYFLLWYDWIYKAKEYFAIWNSIASVNATAAEIFAKCLRSRLILIMLFGIFMVQSWSKGDLGECSGAVPLPAPSLPTLI